MMKPIAAALVSTVILAGCASPASLKPQGVFLLSPASLAPQGVDLFKELQDMRISAAKVAIQSKLDQKNYFAAILELGKIQDAGDVETERLWGVLATLPRGVLAKDAEAYIRASGAIGESAVSTYVKGISEGKRRGSLTVREADKVTVVLAKRVREKYVAGEEDYSRELTWLMPAEIMAGANVERYWKARAAVVKMRGDTSFAYQSSLPPGYVASVEVLAKLATLETSQSAIYRDFVQLLPTLKVTESSTNATTYLKNFAYLIPDPAIQSPYAPSTYLSGAPQRDQMAEEYRQQLEAMQRRNDEMAEAYQRQVRAQKMQELSAELDRFNSQLAEQTARTLNSVGRYSPPPVQPIQQGNGSIRCITVGIYTNCR